MSYILNIGLAREGKPSLTPQSARKNLRSTGFIIGSSCVVRSDTELTLVAQGKFDGTLNAVEDDVWAASAVLEQDCIGVYDTNTGKGALIGPRADKWGEFNPEYFLLLDGSCLSAKGE